MATRQIVIKTGVVRRLIKDLSAYEKEANDRLADVEKVKVKEGIDEYDVRQAERIHAESAKMIPDTSKRLTKAAEELRELMGENESTLSDTKEYKEADECLNRYYELDDGKLVQDAEAEPKDIRESDY